MTAITTAARLLRVAADELKNAHTLGGNWGNELEALDAYNEHMATATTLEHMARQCLAQIEEPAQPVCWIRFCSDGSTEGPIMHSQICEARKTSGAWTPLYAGAAPAAVAPLPQVLEQIAQAWDGCKYDAPGETIDIGADIRAAAARLIAEQPAAVAPQGEYPQLPEAAVWSVAGKDGMPTLASGWMFSPVQQGNATLPLFTARQMWAYHDLGRQPASAPALEAPAATVQFEAWWKKAGDGRSKMMAKRAWDAAQAAAPQAPRLGEDALHLLRRLLSNQHTLTGPEFRSELEKIVAEESARHAAAPQAPAAPSVSKREEKLSPPMSPSEYLDHLLAAPAAPVGWFKYDRVSQCWHPQHEEYAATHAEREGWKQLYFAAPAAPVDMDSAEAYAFASTNEPTALLRHWFRKGFAAGQAAPAAPAVDAPKEVDPSLSREVYRACEDLPEGWSIRIDLENGYGGVKLIDPDGEEDELPVDGLLSDAMRASIAAAQAAAKGTSDA